MLRRLWFLVLGALLLVAAAVAPLSASAPQLPVFRSAVPEWVLRSSQPAEIDFDFQNGRYWQRDLAGYGINQLVTVSRASLGYIDDTSGLWASVAANLPRISNKGLLVEEVRTNVVLWNRDLTNAAWTKSNVTTALDQTGIDGSANSASSLTATAGNGTVLQGITLASSARWQTAFVKRITGSGTVNMTTDNGSTWTAVTPCSASTFIGSASCRVSIPTQTLANPTVGFRIVTSGDAIAVDFVQNENSGSFATSPILVTTVAQLRAADVVTVTRSPVFGSAATLFLQGNPLAPLAFGTNQIGLGVSDGTNNDRFQVYRGSGTGKASYGTTIAGVSTTVSNAADWVGSNKTTAAFSSGAQSGAFAGVASADAAAGFPAGLNTVNIGSRPDGLVQFNGYGERIALWPTARLPPVDLQGISR